MRRSETSLSKPMRVFCWRSLAWTPDLKTRLLRSYISSAASMMIVKIAVATITSVSVKPRWRLVARIAFSPGLRSLRLDRVDDQAAVAFVRERFVPRQHDADLEERRHRHGGRVRRRVLHAEGG